MSGYGNLKPDKTLPASLAAENSRGKLYSVICVALFFLLVFAWWTFSGRELLRQEGFFATCAGEYRWGLQISAHGVVRQDIQPLYPALAALLYRAGVPMEIALRLISVVMLAAWALLAGIAVAMRRNFRAGIVTFCCCAGTILAMDKGIDGSPATMTAFFLLAAQLVFFHYGSRLANWNKAWLGAAVLWILAFFSGGPVTIWYFVLPLLFLRRPLSVGSKFNAPGFFAGGAMMVLAVIAWAIAAGLNIKSDLITVSDFSSWDHLKQLFSFPAVFVVRMMPWAVLCWLPLCPALQQLDATPVFSKYLRTLFFTSFIFFWLMPDRPGSELFIVAGPLAMLTGLNYELGIRRYWKWFRQSFFAGEIFLIAITAAMIVLHFFPDEWLNKIPFIRAQWWRFRTVYGYAVMVYGAIAVAVLFIVNFHLNRRKAPIWHLILQMACVMAVFFNVLLLPNFTSEKRWRMLGRDIKDAIREEQNVDVLYKLDIDGMFCGLFYSGVPVKKIRSLNELSGDETVYLISSSFPRHFGWRWAPLLPPGYTFEDKQLFMWRGVPVPPGDEDDTEAQ